MDNLTFFDSIAERWDEIAIHDLSKVEYLIKNIQIKKNDRIIDLGCGTGVLIPFLKYYLEKTRAITAIDISPKMIEIAKTKNGTNKIEYVCMDFYNFKNTKKYDIIIAYSCFPHFVKQDDFFVKCNKLLVDKGKLVIAHSESRDEINRNHNAMNNEIEHNCLVSAKSIVITAKKYGFIENRCIDNDELYFVMLAKNEES